MKIHTVPRAAKSTVRVVRIVRDQLVKSEIFQEILRYLSYGQVENSCLQKTKVRQNHILPPLCTC